MSGRGVDQILPTPSEPTLYESFITDARDYVQLAERRNGPIPRDADFEYVWGAALDVWREYIPDLYVMNLETSVTTHAQPWPEKGIHYRMHPANSRLLQVSGTDNVRHAASGRLVDAEPDKGARQVCYSLANNHVLDFGRDGLRETLQTLESRGLSVCGAGRSAREASAAARPEGTGADVFAVGIGNSGIPGEWKATDTRPGVHAFSRLNRSTIDSEAARIRDELPARETGIVSVHWGGNWDWSVSKAERAFAHELIDNAGVSIVHGHSSHHMKGIELYHGALILYGCGDFVSDYEGIPGHESYRPDLSIMYFADIDPDTRTVESVRIVPLQSHRFSLRPVSASDLKWVEQVFRRESEPFDTTVARTDSGELVCDRL